MGKLIVEYELSSIAKVFATALFSGGKWGVINERQLFVGHTPPH